MQHRVDDRRGSPWGRACTPWLALALVLCACSNDLDALYGDGVVKDAGAMPTRADSGPPTLPTDPYEAALQILGTGACEECARRECENEARLCAKDTACADDARCRAGAGAITDTDQCRSLYTLQENPAGPLIDCVVLMCAETCQPGRDFTCVGSYNTPRPQSTEPVVLTLQPVDLFSVEAFPAGIRARVCAFGDEDCQSQLDEASTDADGIVKVRYSAKKSAGGLLPFWGYFELSDPELDAPRIATHLVYFGGSGLPAAPARGNDPERPARPVVQTPMEVAAVHTVFGVEEDPSRGVVNGVVWDCRGMPARGVTVRVSVSRSEESTVYYGASTTLTETDELGVFSTYSLMPGSVEVTAFHDDTPVSVIQSVVVRANATSSLMMAPTATR